MSSEIETTPSAAEKDRQLAALSYVWIFSVFILIARRESAFIQLHARQGFVLFLLSILLWPFAFTRYAELLVLALMVLGFIQAALGKTYEMPVISDLAEGKIVSLQKAWHYLFHHTLHLVKNEHVVPEFKTPEERFSELTHRVEDDEKRIQTLESKLL